MNTENTLNNKKIILDNFNKGKFEKVIKLGKKFNGYNWSQNFGYGTRQHLKAIKRLGISPHHRKTFSPFKRKK